MSRYNITKLKEYVTMKYLTDWTKKLIIFPSPERERERERERREREREREREISNIKESRKAKEDY